MIRTIFFTFWCACRCVIIRSLLKHTDLNITDFWSKILLFPEDCSSSAPSQDLSDKKIYLTWKCTLGSTLQFALSKLKSVY